MVRIKTSELKENMVVARPVVAHGRVLLAAGVAVTGSHLRILATWGVQEIMVEGDPHSDCSHASQPIDTQARKTIEHAIEKRFSKSNTDNEIIALLKNGALRMEIEQSIQGTPDSSGE
ncbi:MAG: hypothetical protein GF350_03220 [Chitinivibrionales bacterium]|nr:hypothetical protein [Chitinivibrionales bacterium]